MVDERTRSRQCARGLARMGPDGLARMGPDEAARMGPDEGGADQPGRTGEPVCARTREPVGTGPEQPRTDAGPWTGTVGTDTGTPGRRGSPPKPPATVPSRRRR
jgi:hypothetical protein